MARMLGDMLDGIESPTLAEKMALEEAARDAVARELGAQRWLCRGCVRTFSARTIGLLACLKLALGV